MYAFQNKYKNPYENKFCLKKGVAAKNKQYINMYVYSQADLLNNMIASQCTPQPTPK